MSDLEDASLLLDMFEDEKEELHVDLTQKERTNILDSLKANREREITTTDVTKYKESANKSRKKYLFHAVRVGYLTPEEI